LIKQERHKIGVQVWQNDKLVRELDVGKAAPSHRHTFVKLAGDHRIYQAAENLRSQLQGKTDQFRDKSILTFDPDQITLVRATRGDEQETFVKSVAEADPQKAGEDSGNAGGDTAAAQWKDSKDGLADAKKIAGFIRDMSALKCQEFIYDREKSAFSNPVATLTLEGTETYTLNIYAKSEDDSDYPAVSSQTDYPFMLSGWRGDKVVEFLADMHPDDKQPEAAGPEDPADNN